MCKVLEYIHYSIQSNVDKCINVIDWSQFVPGVLETFIGVLIALVFQKIYEDQKDAQEANKQKQRIKNELSKIVIDLTQIQENNVMVLNPIKMPIFQGLMNSTKLSLLERFIWYDEMLSVYNELSSYISWCEFRLTHCRDENINTTDDIIKKMEASFLGEDYKKNTRVCRYSVCPIYANCKSKNIHLKGSVKCLLAKVSIDDKTDEKTVYGRIKRFLKKWSEQNE